MAAAPTTLNVHVPWPELAQVLEISLASEAIPATAICPLCSKHTLHVYEDIAGGCYHSCRSCGSRGDMIELAARVWNVDILAAVRELATRGLAVPTNVDAVAAYVKGHHELRQRVRELWNQAQEHYRHGSAAIKSLQHRFRLGCDVSVDRWRAGPGRLLGSISHDEAERCFRPNHVSRRGGSSPDRLFRGGKWSDVLVLPYWGGPGNITAFRFIGRQGGAEDTVNRDVDRPQGSKRGEGGLFGLPAALDDNRTGVGVVAVEDPLLAARLHVRHASLSGRSLPLVAWQNSPPALTSRAWQNLDGRPLVLWGQELTAELLDQAMRTDGRISLAGPYVDSKQTLDHYVRLIAPADLLRRVEKQARPWRDCLMEWLRQASGVQVRCLFVGLEHVGRSQTGVLEELPKDVQQSVMEITAPVHVVRTRWKKFNAGVVTERLGGWYYRAGSGKQESNICNLTLRIDKIEVLSGKNAYSGVITYKDASYPVYFTDRQRKRLYEFLQDALLREAGAVMVVKRGWRGHLWDLAIAFHTPEVVDQRSERREKS